MIIIMDAKEILRANQKLTLKKAMELKGKTIRVTNTEYYLNEPHVRVVKVEPITEWDAAKDDKTAEGFANRQEYWQSYMTPKQIERMKHTYRIGRNELGNLEGFCNDLVEDTFHGSDEDRPIYYVLA